MDFFQSRYVFLQKTSDFKKTSRDASEKSCAHLRYLFSQFAQLMFS